MVVHSRLLLCVVSPKVLGKDNIFRILFTCVSMLCLFASTNSKARYSSSFLRLPSSESPRGRFLACPLLAKGLPEQPSKPYPDHEEMWLLLRFKSSQTCLGLELGPWLDKCQAYRKCGRTARKVRGIDICLGTATRRHIQNEASHHLTEDEGDQVR